MDQDDIKTAVEQMEYQQRKIKSAIIANGRTIERDLEEFDYWIPCIRNGEVTAAFRIFNYDGEDCEICAGSLPGGFTRDGVIELFDHIFHKLGCIRCTVQAHEENEKSLAVIPRFGFVLEGYRRGTGMLQYGMTYEDYRNSNFYIEAK